MPDDVRSESLENGTNFPSLAFNPNTDPSFEQTSQATFPDPTPDTTLTMSAPAPSHL